MAERTINEILDAKGSATRNEPIRILIALREAREVLKEINEYREIASVERLLKKWDTHD